MPQETELGTAELENGSVTEAEGDGAEEGSPADSSVDPALLREMITAGLCYGRSRAKTHPRMKPYIFAARNGIELIDVGQTWRALTRALEALRKTAAEGKQVLVVGTQPAAEKSVLELAEKFGLPYVVNRWPGGALTNFKTIGKRIEHFKKLKTDRASGRLEKYTKKERLGIDRQIAKMDELFRGIENMAKLPGLMLVLGSNLHEISVHEARRTGIPIIAVMNSDSDPDAVEYPIPANDTSRSSIAWLFAKFEAALEEGRKEATVKSAASEEEKKESS